MTVDWNTDSILLIGARGMLGRELVRALCERMGASSDERLVARDIDELDITDPEAVCEQLTRIAPRIVVNAAAYTNVDGCETNRDAARAANVIGPGNLARTCADIDALLVHFGTDFVFDGRATQPYQPNDDANPLSVYGRTKWDGEGAIRAAACRHLIVRTSWLFGVAGRNFVEAIIDRAESGEPLRVVDDQIGCPTYAVDLAEAVIALLNAGADGVVHFCNDGPCSWFDFAVEIVGQLRLGVSVAPIRTSDLDRPAHRPAFSVLDSAGYVRWTGRTPPPWKDALRRYLASRPARDAIETSAVAPVQPRGER